MLGLTITPHPELAEGRRTSVALNEVGRDLVNRRHQEYLAGEY